MKLKISLLHFPMKVTPNSLIIKIRNISHLQANKKAALIKVCAVARYLHLFRLLRATPAVKIMKKGSGSKPETPW